MKYVGVDIGGTNLKAGLVDENGNLRVYYKVNDYGVDMMNSYIK